VSGNGKQHRKTVSSTSQERCLQKMRALEVQVAAGAYAGAEITFADRADDWLADMKFHVKARSFKLYRGELALGSNHIGRRLIGTTAAHIRSMQRAVAEQVGPTTAKKVRDRVSAVLEAAFSDEDVPRNVARQVKDVKVPKAPIVIWSSAEIDLFLGANKHHWLYPLLFSYLSTGARAAVQGRQPACGLIHYSGLSWPTSFNAIRQHIHIKRCQHKRFFELVSGKHIYGGPM
jgi:hypothetical protein